MRYAREPVGPKSGQPPVLPGTVGGGEVCDG